MKLILCLALAGLAAAKQLDRTPIKRSFESVCPPGEAVSNIKVYDLTSKPLVDDILFQVSCVPIGPRGANPQEESPRPRQPFVVEGRKTSKEGQVHFGSVGAGCPTGSVLAGLHGSYEGNQRKIRLVCKDMPGTETDSDMGCILRKIPFNSQSVITVAKDPPQNFQSCPKYIVTGVQLDTSSLMLKYCPKRLPGVNYNPSCARRRAKRQTVPDSESFPEEAGCDSIVETAEEETEVTEETVENIEEIKEEAEEQEAEDEQKEAAGEPTKADAANALSEETLEETCEGTDESGEVVESVEEELIEEGEEIIEETITEEETVTEEEGMDQDEAGDEEEEEEGVEESEPAEPGEPCVCVCTKDCGGEGEGDDAPARVKRSNWLEDANVRAKRQADETAAARRRAAIVAARRRAVEAKRKQAAARSGAGDPVARARLRAQRRRRVMLIRARLAKRGKGKSKKKSKSKKSKSKKSGSKSSGSGSSEGGSSSTTVRKSKTIKKTTKITKKTTKTTKITIKKTTYKGKTALLLIPEAEDDVKECPADQCNCDACDICGGGEGGSGGGDEESATTAASTTAGSTTEGGSTTSGGSTASGASTTSGGSTASGASTTSGDSSTTPASTTPSESSGSTGASTTSAPASTTEAEDDCGCEGLKGKENAECRRKCNGSAGKGKGQTVNG